MQTHAEHPRWWSRRTDMERPEFNSIQGLITLVQMIKTPAMDLIITQKCSSECPHLSSVPLLPSRLSYLLSWGRMQYTRLLDSWLNAHAGLCQSWNRLIHDSEYTYQLLDDWWMTNDLLSPPIIMHSLQYNPASCSGSWDTVISFRCWMVKAPRSLLAYAYEDSVQLSSQLEETTTTASRIYTTLYKELRLYMYV